MSTNTTTDDTKARLVAAIRSYVHMDNLAESHARQASNARAERGKQEATAIALMKQMGLTGSTIKVSGAALQIGRRRASAGLSWGFLEKEAPRSGLSAAQTSSLLKWLHEHRETKEVEFLKKVDGPPNTG